MMHTKVYRVAMVAGKQLATKSKTCRATARAFATSSARRCTQGVPTVAARTVLASFTKTQPTRVTARIGGAMVATLGAAGVVMASVSCAGVRGGHATMFELSDVDSMLENAEKYTRQQTYDTIKALDERDPENPKVMWRLARALYEVSGEATKAGDKVKAKASMEEAYAIIMRAVELDRTDNDVHRWCGNILNGLSAFISTKESIANSYRIREHWEDAISCNPNDASAKALLGRWAFEVASLSWIKRNIAKALFGTPPTATYDEALEFCLGAEQADPGFWMMNRVTIARCYYQLSKKEEAIEWARKALEIPARSQDDQAAVKLARDLLKKLGAPAV